jgi:dTDP-4-dehydrorhamnose reductase
VKVCGELDCTLVQISTDYVFGADHQRRTPYMENDQPGPLGVYARSKLAGELAAASWKRHLIVRTCGLYGRCPKPTQSNFVDTILRLGGQRERLRVVDDQCCTPSYVRDIARAIVFLIRGSQHGTFHVVNSGCTTWYGCACEILRYAGITTPIEPITTAAYGAPAKRPAYSVLDTTKYEALGGPRLPPWQAALRRYLRSPRTRSHKVISGASRAA